MTMELLPALSKSYGKTGETRLKEADGKLSTLLAQKKVEDLQWITVKYFAGAASPKQ